MTLRDIAVNNLRRRKGKTLFLVVTFLIVVATTVALNAVSLGIRKELDKKLDSYGANIVITAKSERLALSYGGLSVSGVTYNVQKLSTSVLERLRQSVPPEGISVIAPKVIGSVEGQKQKYLLVGVDFPTELKMKSWWKIRGREPSGNEIVIGSSVTMREKVGPDNKMVLNGQDFTVSGVLEETGGSEDKLIFSTIDLARKLTGQPDSFTIIEINAKNPEAAAAGMAKILPEAQVTPVTQLVQGAVESSKTFSRFAFSVSVLLALVGTMVVVITLASNVNDRTREFGIFRAIGFRQSHILRILFTEVLFISLTGGISGYLLGILAPTALGPIVQKTSVAQQGVAQALQTAAVAKQQVIGFSWYPALGVAAILGACVIGLVAIAYPAWRAAKLDPSEALRFI